MFIYCFDTEVQLRRQSFSSERDSAGSAYTSMPTRHSDSSLKDPDRQCLHANAHLHSNLPIHPINTHYISTSSSKIPQHSQFSFSILRDPDKLYLILPIAKDPDSSSISTMSSYVTLTDIPIPHAVRLNYRKNLRFTAPSTDYTRVHTDIGFRSG